MKTRILAFVWSVCFMISLVPAFMGTVHSVNAGTKWLDIKWLPENVDLGYPMYVFEYEGNIVAVTRYQSENGDAWKCGIVDFSGTVFVPAEYDNIYPVPPSLRHYVLNGDIRYFMLANVFPDGTGEYFIYDIADKTIKQLNYDYVQSYYGSDVILVRNKSTDNGSVRGLLDVSGNEIIPLGNYFFDSDSFKDYILWSRYDENDNTKYVYLDKTGKNMFSMEFDYASRFSKETGLACVGILEGDDHIKYGYIDKTGNLVVPFEYDAAAGFYNDLAYVGLADSSGDMKYGYIDKTGKIVIPLIYDDAGTGSLYDGKFVKVAKKDESGNLKWGCIDKTGEMIIPFSYDSITKVSDSFVMANYKDTDNKTVIVILDNTGKTVATLPDNIISWGYGGDFVTYGIRDTYGTKRYGAYDLINGLLIDAKYDSSFFHYLDGELIVVRRTDNNGITKCGCLNKNGEIVIPLEYSSISYFSSYTDYADELVCVHRIDEDDNEKRRLFRKTGEIVTAEYDFISAFIEGLCVVGIKGADGALRYHYIDIKGNDVFSTEFDDAKTFVDGLAAVGRKDKNGTMKYGYIDVEGNVVIPFQYDGADSFYTGNESINASAGEFYKGLAQVKMTREGKDYFGLIDKKGNEILPLEYEEIGCLTIYTDNNSDNDSDNNNDNSSDNNNDSSNNNSNNNNSNDNDNENGNKNSNEKRIGYVKKDGVYGIFDKRSDNSSGSAASNTDNDGLLSDIQNNGQSEDQNRKPEETEQTGKEEKGDKGDKDNRGNKDDKDNKNDKDNKAEKPEQSSQSDRDDNSPVIPIRIIVIVSALTAAVVIILSICLVKKTKKDKPASTSKAAKPPKMQASGTVSQQMDENKNLELLMKYKELLDAGAITEEEYNKKKAELLKL